MHRRFNNDNNLINGEKKFMKSLPEYFFEKVLDLELLLKREFSMDYLKELVNKYSV